MMNLWHSASVERNSYSISHTELQNAIACHVTPHPLNQYRSLTTCSYHSDPT